jgi:parvulin-like peptidyl-prolyl isomerase
MIRSFAHVLLPTTIDRHLAALVLPCLSLLAIGQPARAQFAGPQQVEIAKVDGEPIFAAEAQRLLDRATRAQKIGPAALPPMQAQVLAEIIDRRLVLAYARQTKAAPTQAEIDKAFADFRAKQVAQVGSLEKYLKANAMTEADLRQQILWNLVWEKFLGKYVTDARAEAYFKAHRREFDGSEVSASHILLKPKTGADPNEIAGLVKQAQAIRREISDGKLAFADAVRKYSAGANSQSGGNLGFIPRRGLMVESFSRAAFALEPGQMSEPVTTPFGVHLIRCEEIRPGKKELRDVRKEIDEALARELLDKIARQQQTQSKIEFTGKWPHFQPGTRGLAP